ARRIAAHRLAQRRLEIRGFVKAVLLSGAKRATFSPGLGRRWLDFAPDEGDQHFRILSLFIYPRPSCPYGGRRECGGGDGRDQKSAGAASSRRVDSGADGRPVCQPDNDRARKKSGQRQERYRTDNARRRAGRET